MQGCNFNETERLYFEWSHHEEVRIDHVHLPPCTTDESPILHSHIVHLCDDTTIIWPVYGEASLKQRRPKNSYIIYFKRIYVLELTHLLLSSEVRRELQKWHLTRRWMQLATALPINGVKSGIGKRQHDDVNSDTRSVSPTCLCPPTNARSIQRNNQIKKILPPPPFLLHKVRRDEWVAEQKVQRKHKVNFGKVATVQRTRLTRSQQLHFRHM